MPGQDPRLVLVRLPCLPRHKKNSEKAQEATVLLKDNLELQNFLQNCKEVRPRAGVILRFQSEGLRGESHRIPVSPKTGGIS